MDKKKKLELYIHIPFCESKCRYCDFLSASADSGTYRDYVDKLVDEIRAQGGNYTDYQINTVFIGGGTPSILPGVYISNLMSAVYENFVVEASAEISIECNPGTLDAQKLEYFKQSGINRISLGLQSTVDKELENLGRIHTYEKFLESYQLVREAGFHNVNIDLMSGLPYQTLESWKSTLKNVVRLKPEHISAYSLIIEEGTEFAEIYTKEEGKKLLPSESDERKMYKMTADFLQRFGYERYEISNYARAGFQSIHNTGYWTGAEYLGMGLGASSYVFKRRFHVEKDIKKYMKIDFKNDITPLYQDIQELTLEDEMSEFMFLGLRMMKGVSGAEFLSRFDYNIYNVFGEAIQRNKDLGLLVNDGSNIRLTPRGIDLSNRVMSDFLLN